MSKRAVILAGGKGLRLRPYTVVLPKPLMPIGEYPILEIVVRQLFSCGFDHITMAVNHQADIIKAYFNSPFKWIQSLHLINPELSNSQKLSILVISALDTSQNLFCCNVGNSTSG